MAVDKHSVTSADVLGDLPIDTSQITGSGQRLNTDQIDNWIERGAGQLNTILSSRGLTSLDDNQKQTVRAGIIAYAGAKALRKLGYLAIADDYWEEWGSIRKTLRDDPDEVGADEEDILVTNVDTSSDKNFDWRNDNDNSFEW